LKEYKSALRGFANQCEIKLSENTTYDPDSLMDDIKKGSWKNETTNQSKIIL